MNVPFNRHPHDLIEELEKETPRFGFFQAVRLLALTALHYGGRRRGKLPSNLRFRTLPSLSFPASEVAEFRPADSEGQTNDEMSVAFMGLTGPSGALPNSYTELVIDRRLFFRDTGLHAFLDLFSHRAISLFYEAWRKYRPWLDVEDGDSSNLTRNLLDFSGVGLQSLWEGLGKEWTEQLNENLFAHYAGLLSQKPISAQVMSTVIQGVFGVPAEIEQFVGQWIEVPIGEQTRINRGACVLGRTAFAGERIWDRQTKIRLHMGPMRQAAFKRLLPGSSGAKALESLVRFMVGHSLACDVTLTLDRRDVPEARLDSGQPLQAGFNAWMNSRTPARDPDEMRFRLLS
jgi:type VI secretion system protein ImpH